MMYWLILRLVLSAQTDNGLVEPLGMRSRLEIPGYRVISRDLEEVADLAHGIANHVREILAEDMRVPGPIVKAIQALAEVIEETYAKALGGLLSRDLKQANEAIRLANGIAKKEQDLVRLVLKEVKDPKVVLPLRGIYSNMAQIGGYAKSIAVIAFNRYLEKPTNLCRSTTPAGLLAAPPGSP